MKAGDKIKANKNGTNFPVAEKKTVLVTGAPRSGTTWVGKMLALPGQLHYVHEPFNPDHPFQRGSVKIKMPRYMMYITEELEEYEKKYLKPIRKLVEGRCNYLEGITTCKSLKDFVRTVRDKKEYLADYKLKVLPLIKDPIALMSAGWLARSFDINVVVMIRHPAAVVASMKRLNWSFDPQKWALSQPFLLRDYLSPYEKELRELSVTNSDTIDRLALMWKIIYSVVLKYQEEYPDWYYLRHEDLAKEPLLQFEKLYRRLGLDYTDVARRKIEEYSNSKNPAQAAGQKKELKLCSSATISNWGKTLSASDIERIRNRVEEISRHYYADCDWLAA